MLLRIIFHINDKYCFLFNKKKNIDTNEGYLFNQKFEYMYIIS